MDTGDRLQSPGSAASTPLFRYGMTVAAVAAAMLARWLLDPLLGDHHPFVTFFVAVAVASWVGGLRTGLLATALGFLLAVAFFVPPRMSVLGTSGPHLTGLAIYFVVCLTFAAFGEVVGFARRRDAEQKERLRTTLASIGDAVISTDRDGNVTYLNAVAESLTGWTNAGAAGLPLAQVFRIVNETTRQPVENPAVRALTEGVIVGLANHTVLVAKDGTQRPIDDSAAPIRSKDGAVVGCVLVFRDIGEKRRLEGERQEAQERVVATLESVTDGFVRYDRDWRIVYVNAEAERINRLARSDMMGKTLWEVFPAVTGTKLDAEFRRAVADRVTVEFENYYEPFGRWYSLKGYPAADGGLTTFIRDITDRKRADALLAGQTRVLELVASDAPLADVLATLCRTIEEQAPDLLCSVLLLDDDGQHLRVGAGPGLPDAYVRHLDGLGIDPPYHGPCGMALHTGQEVVVTDARSDGRWPAAWRELVAGHGLRACRTTPVTAADGTPLATFAVYSREPGDPGPADPTVLQVATHLAAVAVQRKRAEEGLRRRAEEVRVLLDTLPVGIFVAHDPEGRTITGNRAAQDLLRTPARNLSLTAPPDELPTTFKVCRNGVELTSDQLPVQRAARGEVVANEEVEVVFADGGVVNELISAAPLYDADGRVRGAVAGVLDISTRKATEGRLRESEQKYRSLFESMDEGYCVIEVVFDAADRPADYRFLEVNPAFERHTGLRDAVGRTIREFAPDMDPFWFDTYGRVARTGEPGRFVNEAVALGRWYDVYAFRLGGAGGNRVAVLFNDITDRKRAEEVVRASEARLRTALTAARMVAWEWTPADGKLRVSENAADVFGLPAGVGLTGIEQGLALLHPDDVAAYRATFRQAIDDQTGYLTHYRLVRPDDGRTIWIEERGHTVFDQPGGGVRLYGVAADVTDRHEAEADRERLLRRVEGERGRLADVFRQAPAFMCVLRGPGHVFEMANDRYFHLVGQRDILGKTVLEAFPEVEEQGFIGMLDGVYRTGEPFVGTGVRLLLDQPAGERYVDFVYQPLRDPDGTVTGVVTVGVDVTARRQTEEALRLSEERFRTLFETMDEGFCVVEVAFDPAGRATDYRIEVMNPAFEKHTGMHGLVGRSIRQAIPALEEFWYEAYGRVASTGEPARFVHQAGPMGGRWFDVSAFRLGGGGSRKVAILFNDITARKQAEAERERLVSQLRDQDRRKDEFLATLAHELRNPLAPIRNGLQVIRMAGANGTVEQARSMMDRQLTQLVRLVDDLLDVSRVTSGKLELRRATVELRGVIDAAVETSRPAIDQAGHELVVAVPDEPVWVDGDHTRLAQVVSNLLNNSAKYTHRGGHLRLAVGLEDGAAVVSVTDDGIGIPPAMLDKVFGMFAQVDRTLEKTTGGLGIGLSLVKGLVEMHGGTIAARSEGEGKGSEFVVRLPVVTPPPAADGPAGGRGEEVVPSVLRRVLVVDDNVDAADSMGQLLELLGNEVRTAHDGEAGVAAAEAFRPGVVLLDLGMPKLNGYEACRRIRGQPWGRDVVLVALTGWGQDDDRRKTAEAGFDHHLVKPVEYATLLKLLTGLRVGTA